MVRIKTTCRQDCTSLEEARGQCQSYWLHCPRAIKWRLGRVYGHVPSHTRPSEFLIQKGPGVEASARDRKQDDCFVHSVSVSMDLSRNIWPPENNGPPVQIIISENYPK